jgi:integrase
MIYDHTGSRKYLTSNERQAFIAAAREIGGEVGTFALTLAFSGARISEALALTPRSFDLNLQGLVIRTLKRRRSDVFRTVPMPPDLLSQIEFVHGIRDKQRALELADTRVWGWCRTTAWTKIKSLMAQAGIYGACAMPKGLRHGLGVFGTAEANVPLNVMQKWMGHARIETTSIYANALGPEERALAARTWQ